MARQNIRVRRVYDEPIAADGTRVLVDRIWPRGMTKSRAGLDRWCKEIAPSTELRGWYHHDPARFGEFRRRYRDELADTEHAAAVEDLHKLSNYGTLTLLTATTDVSLSAAVVLAELLSGRAPVDIAS